MGNSRQGICFWYWACVLVASLADECVYKECQCYSPNIMCTNTGLKEMPSLISMNTTGFTSLDIDMNEFTTIPHGSFPPNLTDLYMGDTPVMTVDDDVFSQSATTLYHVSIYNVSLKRIPNAFNYLQNLREFYISYVPIEDWNDEAMRNIGLTLEILNIENVNLTTSPVWLQYFSRMTQLTIISSLLTSLPDNAMDKMANSLTFLSLYNNSLTEVPKALSKVNSLSQLYLGNNRIVRINWLPRLCNLTYLSLSNNQISNTKNFTDSLRQCKDSLTDLTVDGNQLTAIPDLSFLTHITLFYFENNQISDPNSGAIPANATSIDIQSNALTRIPQIVHGLSWLTNLVISYNFIAGIHAEDFPVSLQTIDLGFNLITELTDHSFPDNSSLENVYLNNNPISKVSSNAFKNLAGVKMLNLQGTQLKRLPVSLSYLTQLYYLDMTNTPTLVCTCLEKNLQPWILSSTHGAVFGDCGRLSIYNFFANFSSGCL